jgi:hypothetical protein
LLLTVAAAGFAADAPKTAPPKPAGTDLKIDQPDSGWHHASGKPLTLVDDPLAKHTGKVVEIPEALNMWLLNMNPVEAKDSVTLSYDAYVPDGNMQVAFASNLAGPDQFKGYFLGIDKNRTLGLSARLGLTGPWEGLGESATKLPVGWVRLKITVFKDGTINVFANDDLYIEKTDKRIPLAPNWINFQSNGDGKKYVANAFLEVK